MIYSLGCPLNVNQLAEITSLEQAVNYFDLMETLESIKGRLCTCTEQDGVQVFANTELGDKAAGELGNDLPQSVREKMFEEAVRVYTRDETRKDSLVSVRYAQHSSGVCNVGVTVKSQATGKQKFYLTITAKDKEEADFIKSRITGAPDKFRRYLEDYFKPAP